jgi:hypothetical protein
VLWSYKLDAWRQPPDGCRLSLVAKAATLKISMAKIAKQEFNEI